MMLCANQMTKNIQTHLMVCICLHPVLGKWEAMKRQLNTDLAFRSYRWRKRICFGVPTATRIACPRSSNITTHLAARRVNWSQCYKRLASAAEFWLSFQGLKTDFSVSTCAQGAWPSEIDSFLQSYLVFWCFFVLMYTRSIYHYNLVLKHIGNSKINQIDSWTIRPKSHRFGRVSFALQNYEEHLVPRQNYMAFVQPPPELQQAQLQLGEKW